MKQPLISIVIVNWKVRKLLEKCLNSILADTRGLDVEIFVVDNDSRDGTPEMILAEYEQVTMISLPRNHGFAWANNLALKQSSGEYLFLLNPDTEVKPGFFQTILDYLKVHPEVGILGPKVLNTDGSTQSSVRRFPTLKSQLLVLLKMINIWPESKTLRQYLAIDFYYAQEQEVQQIMGAAMVWRREVFEQVGFFDDKFFTWFEEVDYCRRAKDKGIMIKYFPGAAITHHGGASFAQAKRFRKQMIFNWSLFYYFTKHHPWYQTLIILIFLPVNVVLTFLYLLGTYRNR